MSSTTPASPGTQTSSRSKRKAHEVSTSNCEDDPLNPTRPTKTIKTSPSPLCNVVLVTGSRNWTSRSLVREALERVQAMAKTHGPHPEGKMLLVEGGCRGADRLAREEAKAMGWDIKTVKADWNQYKAAAGPIRNKKMVVEYKPQYAVAFRLPSSRGTNQCLGLLRKHAARDLILLSIVDAPDNNKHDLHQHVTVTNEICREQPQSHPCS